MANIESSESSLNHTSDSPPASSMKSHPLAKEAIPVVKNTANVLVERNILILQ